MFYLPGGSEMPLSLLRYVMAGAGIVMMYLGAVLPKLTQRRTPDSIIFDNANGRVQVNQTKSEVDTAYIYYDEIKGFIIKAKSRSDSRSADPVERTRYSHNIYLVKKDGGEWELLQLWKPEDAEAELAKLRGMITLDAVPVRVPVKLHATSKYAVKKGSDRIELEWRNPVGTAPLSLLLIVAFVGSILYVLMGGFGSDGGGFFIPGVIIGGLVGLVFLWAVIRGSMKVVKDYRTVYSVTITGGSFSYFEKSTDGRERKHVQYALQDIHSIAYSFDTEKTARKLFVYTRGQAKKKEELGNSFSLSNIAEYWELEKSLTALDMSDLTPVEALAVENLLQEAIREKGNTQVR